MEPPALFNRVIQVLFRIRRFFRNLKCVKARPVEVTPPVFQIPVVRPSVSSYPDVTSSETINQIVVQVPGRNEEERVSEHERCDNPSATYRAFSSVRGLFKRRQAARPTPPASGSPPHPSPNDVVIVDIDSPHTLDRGNEEGTPQQNHNTIFKTKRVGRGSVSGDSPSLSLASQSTADIGGVDDVVAGDSPRSINVEKEESGLEKEQNDDILYEYYSILYKSATIPEVPDGKRPKCVQVGAYWTIAILALLYRATFVKDCFLVSDKSASVIEISISIAFQLSLLLFTASWTYTSIKRERGVSGLVKKSKETRHLFPKSHKKRKGPKDLKVLLSTRKGFYELILPKFVGES